MGPYFISPQCTKRQRLESIKIFCRVSNDPTFFPRESRSPSRRRTVLRATLAAVAPVAASG